MTRKLPSLGSLEDTPKLPICGNFGETSKMAGIALQKFRQNGGTTLSISIRTETN
jgi:hypothetical protein